MRPKKIILCVNDNEQELSVMSFLLATHGYRVLSASNPKEAISLFESHMVDLVLAEAVIAQVSGDLLIGQLKKRASHVPMVLFGDPQKLNGQPHAADAFLAKKNCSSQDLLERVKVMSARKRGPRKGMHRAAAGGELAVAS